MVRHYVVPNVGYSPRKVASLDSLLEGIICTEEGETTARGVLHDSSQDGVYSND